jgi:ketosteroid isomerase-like protein
MRTAALFSATVLTLLSCSPAPADTSAAAKLAIDANNAAWARLSAAGHSDSIAEYYHPNGVLLPPNQPAVRGRDSIRVFFAVLNTMSSPPPTLSIRAEEVWASGPSATELGRWTFTWPAGTPLPPGAMAVDSGKYMARWVEENGQWLMVQDIWNSDLAPPPPPPAGR